MSAFRAEVSDSAQTGLSINSHAFPLYRLHQCNSFFLTSYCQHVGNSAYPHHPLRKDRVYRPARYRSCKTRNWRSEEFTIVNLTISNNLSRSLRLARRIGKDYHPRTTSRKPSSVASRGQHHRLWKLHSSTLGDSFGWRLWRCRYSWFARCCQVRWWSARCRMGATGYHSACASSHVAWVP